MHILATILFFLLFTPITAQSQDIIGGPWVIDSLIWIKDDGERGIPYSRGNQSNILDLSLVSNTYNADGTAIGTDERGEPTSGTWAIIGDQFQIDNKGPVGFLQTSPDEFQISFTRTAIDEFGEEYTGTLITKSIRASALPVGFVFFRGQLVEKSIQLSWSTGTEINNSHFLIEHSSNGQDFESIGQVDGSGMSNTINQYTFTHDQPTHGQNYYRLQQVDYDGSSSYSRIVSVYYEKELWKIHPNPVTSILRIDYEGNESTEVKAALVSMNGHLVKRLNGSSPFDVSDVKPGAYRLIIENPNGSKEVKKIIKQ